MHSRTDTIRTSQALLQKARDEGKGASYCWLSTVLLLDLRLILICFDATDFSAAKHQQWGVACKDINRSRNAEMKVRLLEISKYEGSSQKK